MESAADEQKKKVKAEKHFSHSLTMKKCSHVCNGAGRRGGGGGGQDDLC